MPAAQWLLLAHQLPTRSSNARVKTWRRLQQIGAVVARNSVYVLPNTDQCREDFAWLRSEIVDSGGEATVFAADVVDGRGSTDIIAAFRQARASDYGGLRRDVDRLLAAARRKRGRGLPRTALDRAIRAARERLTEIDRIDFFHAPGRDDLAGALSSLERLIAPVEQDAQAPRSALRRRDFVRRRWVTRPRPGVDRMASAWLIRRYIDPKATFGFVARPNGSDVPFDMYEVEFSHHGPYCTFEVLARRFAIDAPAVARIGHIVHDLDMKETRYGVAEAPAVERMVEGLHALHRDDRDLLEAGIGMFEALARAFDARERAATPGRAPKTRTRRRSRLK